MTTRVLLAPGLEVSRVVTESRRLAGPERGGTASDPAAVAKAADRCVGAGLTTFEMSLGGVSDGVVAGALARREDVRLLARWAPEPGASAAPAETVAAAVGRALALAGADRVDLLQYHARNYADPSWLDHLFELAEHRAAGRIRHLGLADCDAEHLDMAVRSGVPVVSNRIRYSLLDLRAAGAMTEVCRRHGIALLARGTLAGGLLSARWLGRPAPTHDEATDRWRGRYLRFIDRAGGWGRFQSLLEAVARVAERLSAVNPDVTLGFTEAKPPADEPHVASGLGKDGSAAGSRGVSLADVARRYVLERPAVAGIVVGGRPDEGGGVEDGVNVLRFSLDDESRRELAEARAELEPMPGECGDEYRRPPFPATPGDRGGPPARFPAPYPVRRRGAAELVSSGTPWEEIAGYSRAVRRGGRIHVAGTTASHGGRVIGGSDPAAQTHFIVDRIEGALRSLGAGLEDVVRTRVYVREGVDWEPVARAHGARFARIRPASTLVYANTIDEELLVEIEAEAEVP